MLHLWLFLWVWVASRHLEAKGSVNVTIDDQDPRITYSKEWIQTSKQECFNQTVSLSNTGGNISYTFEGTQVYVFGMHYVPDLSSNNTTPTYRIDDQATVETYVDSGLKDPQQSRRLLFTSGPLLSQQHTLTVTTINESSWFWLDFLVVTSTSNNESSATTDAVQSSGTDVTIAVIPKMKFITTSSIIALSFGGAAVVLIVIFGVLYCRSLRQPARSHHTASDSSRGVQSSTSGHSISNFEAIMFDLPRPSEVPQMRRSTSKPRKRDVRFEPPKANRGGS